jgi:mannobiose 2-epimerase
MNNTCSTESMEIQDFKLEMKEELNSILSYWIDHTVDHAYGGFIGRIDHDNTLYPLSPKGSVLNARILWAFSAAFLTTGNQQYLAMAKRAYQYIDQYFIDKKYGGVYWSVNYKGEPLDTKKQIYAIAFVLYAFCEYYKATADIQARNKAIELYYLIQQHSYDPVKGGYFEAFSENWQPLEDLRLSTKDANEKKTMNTHLHILEAYTNLYRIWPFRDLAKYQKDLINHFLKDIIHPGTGHLQLFFDEDWQVKGNTVSYGHDIEASWLLPEAAAILKDEELIVACNAIAVCMTEATMEGIDTDGGLWYEKEPMQQHLVKEKHSWPQAEALVGFINAWQITGNKKYLQSAYKTWQFIQAHIIDKKKGEWFWGVYADYSIMHQEDKVGIWKCPYHNTRACLELLHRLK